MWTRTSHDCVRLGLDKTKTIYIPTLSIDVHISFPLIATIQGKAEVFNLEWYCYRKNTTTSHLSLQYRSIQ